MGGIRNRGLTWNRCSRFGDKVGLVLRVHVICGDVERFSLESKGHFYKMSIDCDFFFIVELFFVHN